MKVIALQGKGNCGKTTTLRELQKLIGSTATSVYKENNLSTLNDAWEVFEYQGKIVGITTRGDVKYLIEQDYKAMINAAGELDVFVCAVHSYGQTVQYAKTLAGEDVFLKISKSIVDTNDKINEQLWIDMVNNSQVQILLNVI